MGCGQSRLSRRIQALPRPNLEGFIRICRSGSLRGPNLSHQPLLREDDVKSTSFEAMPLPLPERSNVKVTVAPHLEKEMCREDHGFEGQERDVREQNVGSISPLKGVFFKDEALVKENPKTKGMDEEEEEEEDKNRGIEEDRWIGRSGSPSFRIYLPESIPSNEDEDDDDNVKDDDADKTSPDEGKSTENPSSNEVLDASETKSGGKGRRLMEAVRRRSRLSCCNASHQQPAAPEK